MPYCQSCGTQFSPGAGFCGACGAPAATAPAPAPAKSPRRSRGYLLWIFGGLVALAILFVVFAIVPAVKQGFTEGIEHAIKSTTEITAMRDIVKFDKILTATLSSEIDQIKTGDVDSQLDQLAGVIKSYIGEARQLDTQVCPHDFAAAYDRYLSAWSDVADAVASHPHVPTEDEAFVEGFFRGLLGDSAGGTAELQDELNRWAESAKAKYADVRRDWNEVVAEVDRYHAQN